MSVFDAFAVLFRRVFDLNDQEARYCAASSTPKATRTRASIRKRLDCATGQVTNCKVSLVVMGNSMKEGWEYKNAFASVAHTTSACVIISISAAEDLDLHSCDLAQAFIRRCQWLHLHFSSEGLGGGRGHMYEVFRPPPVLDSQQCTCTPPHADQMVQVPGLQNSWLRRLNLSVLGWRQDHCVSAHPLHTDGVLVTGGAGALLSIVSSTI
eukprot:2929541-Rhodomonas_salina.3